MPHVTSILLLICVCILDVHVFEYPKTVEANKLLPTYKLLLFILTIDPPFI